jgi:hypothetical protein
VWIGVLDVRDAQSRHSSLVMTALSEGVLVNGIPVWQ